MLIRHTDFTNPAIDNAQGKRTVNNSFNDMMTNIPKNDSVLKLVADSLTDTRTQIMQEITSTCKDSTGNSIDMHQLNELLDLYIEAVDAHK